MQKRKAYKFRLKTKSKQARTLLRFAGSCRYVYNQAFNLQKKLYAQSEKQLSYAGLCGVLSAWKKEKEKAWLNDMPSQSLQQSLKDLDRAYQNFFKKLAGFPDFKKRGVKDSFRYPQGWKLDQVRNCVFLPKIGWIKYANSQEVFGTIKNVTVSCKAGGWYVSIQTEREVAEPIHPQSDMVGIDVGVNRFAVLSTKEDYVSCHALKGKQKRLKGQQRKLCRKVKLSQNWKKQKYKIAKLHHKIANIRLNHLHHASAQISKNHAMIVLEDLQIKNMSKSAAGTLHAPGKNVKAKSGLNRAILDQGWGEFRRQLFYKAKWLGGDVLLVNPKYTSQTCPQTHCRYVSRNNRKTQSEFVCRACGFKENADYVGALNILAAGHAVLACGETVQSGRSEKQEPNRTAVKAA